MKSNNPTISIIIPVLNEENYLGALISHLKSSIFNENVVEIICVDGGSLDNTVPLAKSYGVKTITAPKGRAKQMNTGAREAVGDILYFLHADTFPPNHFDQIILNAIHKGHESGCFRMKFDTKNPVLRFFAWLSRINHSLCRGGDQSLFIKKELFQKTGGFNEAYLIYEDTELIRRLYDQTSFVVLPHHVMTSARKYREKGWMRVQFHFAMIHFKNYRGAGPDELFQYYSKHILNA